MTPLKKARIYRTPAPTCTHLHLRCAQPRCKCALHASAVQVRAAAQRRCRGEHAARPDRRARKFAEI
jgi:hypothetical protein